ncbi:MAG: hypothetical protein EPO21_05430, partial [Chloroflexota bacterium]
MKLLYKVPLLLTSITLAVGIASGIPLLFESRKSNSNPPEQAAISLAKALRASIEQDMIDGHPDHVKTTLAHLPGQRSFLELAVVAGDGRIAASSNQADIGQTAMDARIRYMLTSGEVSLSSESGDRSELSFVLPITLKPECIGCHSEQEKVLGAVLSRLDTSTPDTELWQKLVTRAIHGMLVSAVIGVALFLSLKKTVVNPLDRVRRYAERLASGDFTAKADIGLFDGVGTLTRGMAQNLILAQEGERRRIARELHDQVGQSLTLVLVDLATLGKTSAAADVTERVAALQSLVVDTLIDVRRLAVELRPSALDSLGLVVALRGYLLDAAERSGIPIDFQTLGPRASLAPAVETALYRIVQESVTNAIRHAKPHTISVTLEQHDNLVLARIRDDGTGFHLHRSHPSAMSMNGLGITGMRERAALLGG